MKKIMVEKIPDNFDTWGVNKNYNKMLKEKHKTAFKELRAIAIPIIALSDSSAQLCAEIGAKLGVTGQTVINYLSGRCKDGFLTEAICNEFKKLK